MHSKLQAFHRETVKEILATLTPKQRLKGLSVEELMKALPPATLEAMRRKLNGEPAEEQECGPLDWSDEFREYLRQEMKKIR